MKIKEIKKVLKVKVVLVRNHDYFESDVTSFLHPELKELKADSLTRIAKENCFDGWSWSGHEHNNEVEAVFYKEEK